MEKTPLPEDSFSKNSTPSQSESTDAMKGALSQFVAARLELAAIEAKEAAEFTVRKVVMAVLLALCGFFIWALILAGLTGILATPVEQLFSSLLPSIAGWVIMLFILAFIHIIVAVILVMMLKKKPAAPLFELSRQEIEKDKAWAKNKP